MIYPVWVQPQVRVVSPTRQCATVHYEAIPLMKKPLSKDTGFFIARKKTALLLHSEPNPSGRLTFDVLREFTSANSSLKQCPARPASWSSPSQSSGRSHGANETIHLLVTVFTHASRSSLYSPHPCGSPANAGQLKRFKLVPDQFVGVPLAPLARYAHRSSPP